MHIAFVEWSYPSKHGGGGAGTYVQIMGRELVHRGHRVSVISKAVPGEPRHACVDGVDIYRIRLGNIHWYLNKAVPNLIGKPSRAIEWGLNAGRYLRTLHKVHPIDLVEYSEIGDPYNLVRRIWPTLMHAHGAASVFKRHCGESLDRSDHLQRRIEGSFFRSADLVLAPSNAVMDEIIPELRLRKKRTCVIPLPLEDEWFCLPSGTINSEPKILFVGRIEPRKGAHTLLEAIPQVLKSVPNARFVFCGAESPQLPHSQIRSLLEPHRANHSVELKNFLTRDRMRVEYQTASLVVHPAIWDNSPYSVYEAMAAAKPVVATNVGGLPELVEDGITGRLVNVEDANSLAGALIELLLDCSRQNKMGTLGREKIRSLSSLETNVTARIERYVQVLDL
jgi:glycosyltransferase involved in cell wall biosynthesis